MSEQELKQKFAEALLKEPDAFKAAFASIPDPGLALQAATLWVNDPIVLAHRHEFLEENGLRSILPTKEEQARDIYAIANNDKVDEEIRLKAHRLFAEVMGHIEKPTIQGGTNILNQGVMIVRDYGTDDDWEQRAKQHQQTLIGNAQPN
jgi:hypothetical protein